MQLILPIYLPQEYEAQMKAYGIPVQSFTWKPASNATSLFDSAAATVKSEISEPTLASVNSSSSSSGAAAHAHPKASGTPDHLHEACHLSTKQLEDLMDDDCSGEKERHANPLYCTLCVRGNARETQHEISRVEMR